MDQKTMDIIWIIFSIFIIVGNAHFENYSLLTLFMFFGVGAIVVALTFIFETSNHHDPKTYLLSVLLVLVLIIFLNHNPYLTELHPTNLSDFIFSLIMPIFWFVIALLVVYNWYSQKYKFKLKENTLELVGLILLAFIVISSIISFAVEPHHNDTSSLQSSNYNGSDYNESNYSQNNTKNQINSTGGSFENQWVKFNYPSNLTIVDSSTNDGIMIRVFNGSQQVGCINDLSEDVNSFLVSGSYNYANISDRKSGIGQNVILTHTKESEYISQVLNDLTENGTENIEKYDLNKFIKSIVGVTASIFGFQAYGDFETAETAVVSLRDGATLNFDFSNNSRTSLNQIVESLIIKKDDVKYASNDHNDGGNVSLGGSFENKWVKFDYPPSITVIDRSTDDKLNLDFVNNTYDVGHMTTEDIPVYKDAGNIIAGRVAEINTESSTDSTPMGSARIELNSTHSIEMGFYPGNETVYNEIIKTLTIKQGNSTPFMANSNLKLSPKISYSTIMSFVKRKTTPIPINYSVFENQWIKFSYPSNLNVTDHSTDDKIEIRISNETQDIGRMDSQGMNIDDYGPSTDPNAPKLVNIAGRKALNGTTMEGAMEPIPSSYIELNHDTILSLVFYSGTNSTYDSIVNSLVIKRDDIKIKSSNLFLDIYNFYKQLFSGEFFKIT